MEIEKLKEKLSEIKDPRRQWGHLLHKLAEIVIIALLSTICLGEDYDDMEEFGKEREEWLKSELGLELKNGIPDGDTFKRILERIKPKEMRQKLNESIEYVRALRDVVAIDGKTKRGSGVKSKDRKPLHIISAFVAEEQLVLGEIASENKQTEIKEIPKLLDEIDVFGSIVTVDAIGCQHEIATKVIDCEADYVIGLKKNQRKLYEAAEEHFSAPNPYEVIYTEEKNGSRIEKREYQLECDLNWLDQADEWTGLQGIGRVKSIIERGDEVSFEIRYYITSLNDVNEFAYAVRKHWSIENQLHWCLDVVYREDKSKAGKGYAAMNLNILEKHALHLVSKADLSKFIKMGKPSRKRKRFKATLNPDVLLSIILPPE